MFSCGKLNGAFVKFGASSDIVSVADAAHPDRMAVLTSFVVENLDDALAKVEAAGGKIHV
jgi:hypothetical protein